MMKEFCMSDPAKITALNAEQSAFVAQAASILQELAPNFNPENSILLADTIELIMIVRNPKLSNLSLLVEYSSSAIHISWTQVYELRYATDSTFEELAASFLEVDFANIKERDKAALEFFKRQLVRQIDMQVTYLRSMPIKIKYLLAGQQIGFEQLKRTAFFDFFKKKTLKTFAVTILEDVSNF